MNVLLHCQVYWPDNSAVSQMITAVAEDTVKAGHAVTVITSVKGYNRNETYSPADMHNGVKIIRVGGMSLNRHWAVGRMLNYLTFILFSTVRACRLPRADCFMVTSVPPFSLWLGLVLKGWSKTPVVYVIEDLYPEILFASGLLRQKSVLGRLMNWVHAGWMRRATAIIVLGDYMKARLLAAYPRLTGKNIYPIHNWQNGELLYPIQRKAGESPVVFQYSGNFGKAHDFQTLLGVARRLRDEAGVRFQFIGGGNNREFVELEIRKNNLSNCIVRDYVPQAQLNASLNEADVCLVTLGKGYEGLIVPSKIYGIMAVGKPVLYIGPSAGEIPELIRQHSLGWVIEPGDEDSLVEAIREAVRKPELRASCGANARRAFAASYERKIATAKYVRVFEECAKSRAAVPEALPCPELQK